LSNRLKEQQLSVSLTDAAKTYVADNAYDPVYGARPIKRYMQSKIETMLGRHILKGSTPPGYEFIIDIVDGELGVK